jgi:plasmid stabilization system protein ParE
VSLPVIFHELAEAELNEAVAHYAAERPRLGIALLAEVERCVAALAEAPLAGSAVEGDVRWWLTRRFPYALLYRPYLDHIRILAVAHHKRRPIYWRARVNAI